MNALKSVLVRWWMVLILLALMPVYVLIAVNNERNVDYVNNGFFTFWLAGKLQGDGQQPYSSQDWINGHHDNGATWIPNKIFPYPLPLALLTTPLGRLPIDKAYILWDILAQLGIAGCILWLSTHWPQPNQQRYVLFVLFAALLNGNIFLGLMTGTFAALYLVFLVLALFFIEKDRPILAGLMLAGLALKPPLLVVTCLVGVWLIIKKNWKAIVGICAGGLGLLFIGLIQDLQWISKFRGASENLLGMRLGNQPTLPSYTRLLCAGDLTCTMVLYGLASMVLLGLFFWLLWVKQNSLAPLEVFSLAIAFGLLLPPYLWSYDYALLLIPICYTAFEFIRRRASYLPSTLFLLLLDSISLFGLFLFWQNPESEALTIQRDMWSIWVAILVLAFTCWTVLRNKKQPSTTNVIRRQAG